ncbi:MAG: DNA translocase FtsK 4TM domain-containing protein [Leptospira sp.]|nr:DNA translocase FtsK 4TM domain-containing protein [Leptospira sp.]
MDKDRAIPRWNAIRQDFSPYLLVCIGVFLLLSLFSFTEGDDGSSANWFGRIGYYVSFTLLYLLGKSAFFLAGFTLILGVVSFKVEDFDRLGKALFFPLFLIASSVSLNILETPMGKLGDGGGILGHFFAWMFGYLFGDTGRVIVVFFLFIYSAIIWLEDTSWGFTSFKLNSFVNQVYHTLGGRRNIAHLKLPNILSKWVSINHNPIDMGNEEQSSTKQWFERKTESEQPVFSNMNAEPSFTPTPAPLPTLEEKVKEQPRAAKVRYKNTSLYQGFFESSGKVFRFDHTSVALKSKMVAEISEPKLYQLKMLDFRTETHATSESDLVDLLPRVSESSSLRKSAPLVDFSDLDLYDEPMGNYEIEENDEIIDEEDDEIIDLPDTEHQNFEIDLLDDDTDDDLMDEEVSEVVAQLEDEAEAEDLLEDLESLPDTNHLDIEEEVPSNVFAIDKAKPKSLKSAPKEETPPGSSVPSVKLKRGKYYISHKLLADHKPTLAFHAKNDSELDLVGKKIEEIIGYYGIESKIVARERGPIITRYELTIPHGVKLNKITTLADELRLHLAVKNIRIVAPIPGKASIGVEVPNLHREDVFLSEILKEQLLQNKAKDLTISIGKDISGKIVMIDLAKLPHLLVAGTTGSGKSVSLNSMITSLICTRSPEEVRFIMIDPKMVEMTLYEDIPHLLMPVITDPKKATKALAWAINEMESRYQIVSKLKSRDFKSYNDKVDEFAHAKGYQKFPYIVIFIDELADLMMVSGKEIEEQITRISQKSRAVGIHLVMATQRPSVDVITGLIKANCPARVAFQVAQKTDSRTILDTNGAESLLGKGDFLYRSPVTSDLLRIQAPFIEEKEIEAIVEEAKRQGSPSYIEMNWDEEGQTEAFSDEDEELFDDAWNIVLTEKKASASYLQRRMRIGYNKAARLMELMEARGYVSPQIGAKPREILRSA